MGKPTSRFSRFGRSDGFGGSNSKGFHGFYRLFWHAFRAPKIGPFGPGRCSGGPGRPCFRGFGADPDRLLPVGWRISGPRATGSAPSNALPSVGEDSSPGGSWGVWTHRLRVGGTNSMHLHMFRRPHGGALPPPKSTSSGLGGGFGGCAGGVGDAKPRAPTATARARPTQTFIRALTHTLTAGR